MNKSLFKIKTYSDSIVFDKEEYVVAESYSAVGKKYPEVDSIELIQKEIKIL